MKLLVVLILIASLTFSAYAQENGDTLKIAPLHFGNKDLTAINKYLPRNDYFIESTYFNEAKLKLPDFNTISEQLTNSQLYINRENSFYYYSKGGYSFLNNSAPLYFNGRFSFKEHFGWSKFDLFFEGGALLTQNLELENGVFKSMDERSVFWNIDAGAAYEFSTGKTLFLKSSFIFYNKKYAGSRYSGGINMKF